ncbi:MAG TPA: serine hydrolase domain-containing protein [Polyangiaceae bacterium]|nr:serine hydrolase domain-containing protein [Polyangiaceae bacterium]
MNEPLPWLQPALSYIDGWLGYQMRATQQPGCAVAISHDGRIVFESAWGTADLRTGEQLTPRHRFRVASHSKTFTATGLMKLREAGKVSLDDRVGRFVSGVHPQVATVTIGQLLSNTSGMFRDGMESSYWTGDREFPDQGSLRRDFELPPTVEAGSRLKYSNHGFGLAGLVIEAIVKEPYVAWIQREIVTPAGLQETTPEISEEAKLRLACGHSGRTLLGRRLTFPGGNSTGALAAATGFVSTAADLCKFFSQLSPSAQSSLLSPVSRHEMTHAIWLDSHSLIERGYGLGTISGTHKKWQWFGHNGAFPGYITRTAVVPAQSIAVSVLTNASDGKAQECVDGILNILQRFHAAPPAVDSLEDWSGRWWSVFGTMDLVVLGDTIFVAIPDQTDPFDKVQELALIGPDEARVVAASGFAHYGETVRLERDRDGQVIAVHTAGLRWSRESDLAKSLLARYDHPPPA